MKTQLFQYYINEQYVAYLYFDNCDNSLSFHRFLKTPEIRLHKKGFTTSDHLNTHKQSNSG